MVKNIVMIVDDDPIFLEEAQEFLSKKGFDVLLARTADEARSLFDANRPVVSLIDRKLPDADGQVLIKDLSAKSALSKFIIITAHASFDSAVEGIKTGVEDYILKPVSFEDLVPKIEHLIRKSNKDHVEEKARQDYASVFRKYVTLFENSSDAILIVAADDDLALMEMNRSAAEMTGYSQEEFISRKLLDLPFVKESSFKKVLEEVRQDKDISSEVELLDKIGRKKPVALTTARYSLEEKNYIQFILHDLSAIKQAENNSIKTERRYQNIINIVPGIVYIMNLKEMRTLYVNERIKPVLGYDASELTSDKELRFDCIHPEDKQKFREALENSRESGQLEIVYRMLHKSGQSVKWFKDVGVVTYEEDKDRLLLNGIVLDITQTKMQQENNSMLSAVAKDISESVIITDRENVISYCNTAALNNFEYSREALIGRQDNMLFSELNLPGTFEEMEHASGGAISWKGEVICERATGESFPAMIWIDPWRDEDSKHRGSVKIITDITEKRILEDELKRYAQRLEKKVEERTIDLKKALDKVEKANTELQRQDALKSKFVSNLAHELINPLAVIKDSFYLLNSAGKDFLDEKNSRILQAARRQTERLIRFAKNMLDLSKIESGVFPMNRSEVDVASLVKEMALQYEQQARERNVKVVLDMKDVPDVVWADSDLIEEVLINLLNNALKYSPDGAKIYLDVFREDEKVCFKVTDEGPGISEEEKDKIFDKYYRILKGGEKGTGLGLSIVKEIVALHRGDIELDSRKGEGCSFTVSIPIDLRNEEK